jgi:uncharacterized BrkB/YihY/UPF0761 family membrane protein
VRRLATKLYDFWWGTGLADDVPALTYYLVLSLGPFALGVAAILALLLGDYVSAIELAEQINRYLPAEVHGDVRQLITSARSGSPVLLLLAVVAMLWTTSGAIGVVERVTSRILDWPRHHIVIGRLRNMALGAMVAVLVILAAGGATVVSGITDIAGVAATLPSWVIVALNAAARSCCARRSTAWRPWATCTGGPRCSGPCRRAWRCSSSRTSSASTSPRARASRPSGCSSCSWPSSSASTRWPR